MIIQHTFIYIVHTVYFYSSSGLFIFYMFKSDINIQYIYMYINFTIQT